MHAEMHHKDPKGTGIVKRQALWVMNCSATFVPTPANAVTGISNAESGKSGLIWSAELAEETFIDTGIKDPNKVIYYFYLCHRLF